MQVYPLREKGQKLAREVVIERGPVAGQLAFRERLPRSGIFLATLVVDTGGTYGLPPLDRAALRRIAPGGMLIVGQEVHARSASIKAKADYWPQVWFCVPHGLELAPPLTTAIETQREMPAWQRATAGVALASRQKNTP